MIQEGRQADEMFLVTLTLGESDSHRWILGIFEPWRIRRVADLHLPVSFFSSFSSFSSPAAPGADTPKDVL